MQVDSNGKKLEINQDLPLLHTLAPFEQQLLICTGTSDWPSIIDSPEAGRSGYLAGALREEMSTLRKKWVATGDDVG